MNLKKKCKVVLLPTTDELSCISSEQMKGKIFYKTSMFTQKHYYLHIISDDEIKEKDWIFYKPRNMIQMASKTLAHNIKLLKELDEEINNFKVISSTDSFLNLPQPSPQFIQKYCDEYNKSNQIVDVMVEYTKKYNQPVTKNYEKTGDLFITEEPKIDGNNCITITKIKENYTLKEISDAFKLEGIHYTENFLYKILNKQYEI